MSYTINQLAKMAKVSTRALHYYDEIGLLKPAFVGENGYRHYEEKELLRLQQILFFRELEFPLGEIKTILNNPEFNINKALSDQKQMLEIERRRIGKLIKTIDRTLSGKILNRQARKTGQVQDDINNKGVIMKDEELYDGFESEEMKEYQAEAKERWGDTDAWKQSQDRVRKMGKEGLKEVQEEMGAVLNAIVLKMDRGIEDAEVQDLIGQYRDQISKFYDCNQEIFRGLAEMYLADQRFKEFFQKINKDLPEFLSKAMIYWCENKK